MWACRLHAQVRVVDAVHRCGFIPHHGEQLALGRGDVVKRIEELQMDRAHVGDAADVGIDQLGQLGDLSRAAHRDLEHHDFGVIRAGEQAERSAQLIVEVAGSLVHAVERGQTGGREILDGRLAVGTGDRDPLDVIEFIARGDAAAPQRLLHVVDQDQAVGRRRFGRGCD